MVMLLAQVMKRRALVLPNESFRLQLAQFEMDILGRSTITASRHEMWNFPRLNQLKKQRVRGQKWLPS